MSEPVDTAVTAPSAAGATKRTAVDMDAHNGLRGALAMWVLLFHCLLFCKLGLDWQGSSLMPMFFMLSGFALAVVYQPRLAEGAPRPVRVGAYLRNRLARVMPTYYVGLALALPLWFTGYVFAFAPSGPQVAMSIIFSVVPVITLLAPGTATLWFPVDGPSWTVCTLLAMWAVLPWFLRGLERVSDGGLLRRLALCYYLQMGVGFALFFGMLPSTGYWPAFATATMHPISRLPVFLMGVYAGVLCARYPAVPLVAAPGAVPAGAGGEGASAPRPADVAATTAKPTLGAAAGSSAVMPWYPTWLGVAPLPVPAIWPLVTQGDWGRTANLYAGGLLAGTLAVGALDTAVNVLSGGGGILGGVWLQLIVPMAQLNVIVGVTRDGGASLAGRALRTPLAQWLGKVSMAVYLVHVPLIHYLAWAVKGAVNAAPPTLDCVGTDSACKDAASAFVGNQLMPIWGIAVVPPAAIALGALVFYFVEEPARKALHAKE